MSHERETLAYALISALTSQGFNYIDVFSKLLMQVVSHDSFVDIAWVQNQIRTEFSFVGRVPMSSLRTIVKRAQKEGTIDRRIEKKYDEAMKRAVSTATYRLNEKGIRYQKRLHQDTEDTGDRIRNLYQVMRRFFVDQRVLLKRSDFHAILISFVRKYVASMQELIGKHDIIGSRVVPTTSLERQRIFIEFIKHLKERDPENCSTLQHIVYGSIISATLYAEHFGQVRDQKVSPCKVFLDTNFLLSALELHASDQNTAALELLSLLKRSKFRLAVFDITLEELKRVIRGYVRYSREKTQGRLRGDPGYGLYETLRLRGWTTSKTISCLEEVSKLLENMDITIEAIPDGDITLYQNSFLRELLKQKKPDHPSLAITHDVAVVEIIRKMRSTRERSRGPRNVTLENLRICFLTSDTILAKLNYQEMDHRENGTVPEVILDSFLTNLLWLKDPNIDFPLEMIIAANARELFASQYVWDRFYKILNELYAKGDITKEHVVALLFKHFAADALANIAEEDIDEVTDNWVLAEAAKASEALAKRLELERRGNALTMKRYKERLQAAIKERDKLSKEAELAGLENIELLQDRIDKHTDTLINIFAERKATKQAWVITALLLAALGVFGCVISTLSGRAWVWVCCCVFWIFIAIGSILKRWPWYAIFVQSRDRINRRIHQFVETRGYVPNACLLELSEPDLAADQPDEGDRDNGKSEKDSDIGKS